MADYEYEAVTLEGEHVRGTLTAADEASARRALGEQELRLLALAIRHETGHAAQLGEEEVITLVETVGAAAANRLPLDLSLAALAEDTDDARLASTARRLASQIGRGDSIEAAAAALDRELPLEVRGLFRAAVASGDMPGAFQQFARQRMAAQKLRRRIRSVLFYPLVVLLIIIPLIAFLSLFVFPQFEALYVDFGLTLPAATEWLLAIAKRMHLLFGGFLLLVVGIPVVCRVVAGQWLVDRLRTTTPVLGRLWMWMGQREFAAALASFLKLRLPLADAIAYTADVLQDRNVARACKRVAEQLRLGRSLGAALGQSIHFDRTLVALVSWGEGHSLVPEALGVATEVFDDRLEQHASLLKRLLPPCLLLGFAAVTFFAIISLFVPMVQFIQNLSGGGW
jgi:type II secretory pathway component PulF